MSRDGWVALPRGAMGLSAVCDCGISWSYSLTIFTANVYLCRLLPFHIKYRMCFHKAHNRYVLTYFNHSNIFNLLTCFHCKVIRLQRSGIDTIKYHTWPRIPMGKWQTHRRHHKREPRGQPFPSRWPQSTYKQTRTKHSQHKTEQKHKRSTKSHFRVILES